MTDIVTGVLNANNVEGWFFETEEYDPEYEEAVTEARQKAREEAEEAGLDEDAIQDKMDEAQDELGQFWDGSSYSLYGDWKKGEDGLYEPDPSGQEGFSAIFNRNYNTIQVVWSKFTMWANRCSPCYPGQGDLDTRGEDYLCYALPRELMDETWRAENEDRYCGVTA